VLGTPSRLPDLRAALRPTQQAQRVCHAVGLDDTQEWVGIRYPPKPYLVSVRQRMRELTNILIRCR
jgi:hypothetical protein